jgi:hypothetical protein
MHPLLLYCILLLYCYCTAYCQQLEWQVRMDVQVCCHHDAGVFTVHRPWPLACCGAHALAHGACGISGLTSVGSLHAGSHQGCHSWVVALVVEVQVMEAKVVVKVVEGGDWAARGAEGWVALAMVEMVTALLGLVVVMGELWW